MIENKGKAFTYMYSKFHLEESSNGWFSFRCPYCESNGYSNTMAVNFSSSSVKCWSASCEFGKGFLDTFIQDEEGLNNSFEVNKFLESFSSSHIDLSLQKVRRSKKFVADKSIILPKGFHTIAEENVHLGKRAASYLRKRGFNTDNLDYNGFGFCNESSEDFATDFYGYLIIPFKSKDRKFNYYIGRDFLGRAAKYKYKNPSTELCETGKSELLYNEPALLTQKRLFINEGWACAETVGKEGVATLGWDISKLQKSKLINSAAKELVFVPDVGFYKEAIKIAMGFLEYKTVKVLNFDLLREFGKDTNDVGYLKMFDLYRKTKALDLMSAINIIY